MRGPSGGSPRCWRGRGRRACAARQFTDLRPAAFALLAINEYLRQFPGDRAAQETRSILAERLLDAFQKNSADDWLWFEDQLTYANAALPHALLLCGRSMRRPPMEAAGLQALEWLVAVQTSPEGHFVPIGNEGFYPRGGSRARFDQQPIEAQTTVSACIAALHLTGQRRWKQEALRAFEWFLGGNDVGAALYDPVTGGCCDGLSPQGPSSNQGAESTLAFLLSLAELRLLEYVIPAAIGQAAGNGQARPAEEHEPAQRVPEIAHP